MTCEVCGLGGYIRLGKRYAIALCRDHEHLIGQRHPDDGKINDLLKAHVDRFIKLPPDYGVAAVINDELVKMWTLAGADMRDV